MANKGIDFGDHTMNHTDLSQLSVEPVREEIVNSKLVIQKYLENNVQFFAYPYDRLTNEVKSIIQDTFSGACSVRLDFVNIRK